MTPRTLIDELVREFGRLVATVATHGGARMPVGHIPAALFHDVATELRRAGVPQKVSADMFGMSLRAYRRRVDRAKLARSTEMSTIWTRVLEWLSKRNEVTRPELEVHFRAANGAVLAGVLNDLVRTGLVERREGDKYAAVGARDNDDALNAGDLLMLVQVYRYGPIELDELAQRTIESATALQARAKSLVAQGRLSLRESQGNLFLHCPTLEFGPNVGWAGAVLDHVHSVLETVIRRVGGSPGSQGGSTYSFAVAPEHPLAPEVHGWLARQRAELSELRRRVDAYNEGRPGAAEEDITVIYLGSHRTTRS